MLAHLKTPCMTPGYCRFQFSRRDASDVKHLRDTCDVMHARWCMWCIASDACDVSKHVTRCDVWHELRAGRVRRGVPSNTLQCVHCNICMYTHCALQYIYVYTLYSVQCTLHEHCAVFGPSVPLHPWRKAPDQSNLLCHPLPQYQDTSFTLCCLCLFCLWDTLCCLWCLRCHPCLTVGNPTLLVTIVNGPACRGNINSSRFFFHICPGFARVTLWDSWPRSWAIVDQLLPQSHRSIGLAGIW